MIFMKILFAIGVFIGCISLAVWGCSQPNTHKITKHTTSVLHWVTVHKDILRQDLSYSGKIRPEIIESLHSPVAGYLKKQWLPLMLGKLT